MPFPPPSRHPLSAPNWHDNVPNQLSDNSSLRLPMSHGINTSISQQPPLPPPMNSMAFSGPSSMITSNSNFMIGQEGDNLIRMNSAIRNEQRIPPLPNNIMPPLDIRGLPQGNLTSAAKQSYPGLEHFKVPASVAEFAIKVQQSQQRLGRDTNCIPETVAIYALNLSGTNIPGTNKPKRVVISDNEMRDSIERGELYTKHESVVLGILTNQVHVPGFNIADYLTRENFSPHEMENIESIHSRIDPYQLICLMEFIRFRYAPELRQHRIPSNEHVKQQQQLPQQSMGPSDFRSAFGQRDNMANTQLTTTPRTSSAAYSPMPIRHETGLCPYEKSRLASQSPSDISRSQASTHRPQYGHPMQVGPSYPNPAHPATSLANNNPRMNPLFFNPMVREQRPSQAPAQTLPLLKVSSPFQPPQSMSSQSNTRPPRSHSTIGGLGFNQFEGSTVINGPPHIRLPPVAHQSSSKPNLPITGLDMSIAPAHSSNAPVAAHMASKTPQTPRLQDNPSRPNLRLPAYNTAHTAKSSNSQLPPLSHLDQLSSPNKNIDLEASNGLNIQSILRQQEIANREIALRRSITPHFNSHLQTHPGFAGPRGMDFPRMDVGSASPSHMQIAHSHDFYRPPSEPHGISMPPPQVRHFNVGPRLPQTTMPNGDSQQKQYSAMLSAYNQHQSHQVNPMPNKSPDNSGAGPIYSSNQQHANQISFIGPNPAITINTSEQSQMDMHQNVSPKQQNARSIITGSASSSAKKVKKSKTSPPINTQSFGNDKIEGSYNSDHSESKEIIPPTTNDTASVTSINDARIGHDPSENGKHLDNLAAAAAAAPALCVRSTSDASMPGLSIISTERVNPTSRPVSDNIGTHCSELMTTVDKSASQKIDTDKGDDIEKRSSYTATPNEETDIKSTGFDNSTASDASTIIDRSFEQTPETSKYQKIFTKKAWLKTYDQEDQSKSLKNTTSSAMVSKAHIELPDKSDTAGKNDESKESSKLNQSINKTNGKNPKSTKRKNKVNRGKSSSLSSLKNNRSNNTKSAENDSEETTASTSELDETTDEADSLKSVGDKKLRRMPKRKVKTNLELNQVNQVTKSKQLKESARRRIKKEKVNSNNSDNDLSTVSNIKRKYNSDDEGVKQKTKKIKDNNGNSWDQDAVNSPKSKKRQSDKFLQTCPCYDIVPKNIRCMECRRVRQSSLKNDKVVPAKQTSRTNWDDFCRFYEFRKLRYNKSDQIVVAGFSEMSDAKDSDKNLWLPNGTDVPTNFNFDVAKYILSNVGPEFCNLVLQERSVQEEYISKSESKIITWKRAVNGLRELCDVCSTTLFNCHFVCERCGFVVCIDCHQQRSRQQSGASSSTEESEIKKENSPTANTENLEEQANNAPSKKSKKDLNGWIYCAKNEEHSADKMILARIVAGDCLEEVWELLHETRSKLDLGQCACMQSSANGISSSTKCLEAVCKSENCDTENPDIKIPIVSHDSSSNGIRLGEDRLNLDIKPTLTKLDQSVIVKKDHDNSNKVLDFGNEEDSQDDSRQVSAAIEECIASLSAKGLDQEESHTDQVTTKSEETSVDSLWTKLCDGDLLVLNQPKHKENLQIFREHWRLGKPILVRGVDKLMNIDLWLPQFFAVQFGDYRSDLVDCRNGDIHRQSMKKYWDGFEPTSTTKKKSKEDAVPTHIPVAVNEEPSAITTTYYCGSALWRLKDWPPGQDFNEILPDHYNDFMNNLPLKSYTTRTGKLNLACRLPREMLKPDLGPKMYSAYGTTKFPERGTTNLHLDISDAINVMVYVGGASSLKSGSSETRELTDKTIEDAMIDDAMKAQIRQRDLIPGAIWHIFKPSDADKMREFLNKVADERKISPEKRTDPIHDQIWYLDQILLDRLYGEYGVKSYPILQCMGDAILIPAGAPHQVKNLQNCIKVANDFVSPENVHWCLKLTDEFRKLPETHINQEDKLQIKNILYHSVKESLQFIKMSDKEIVNKAQAN